MALNEFNLAKVSKVVGGFCSNRIPVSLSDNIKLDYSIRGNFVTLFECRRIHLEPTKWSESKIAQFRYDIENKLWTLYWWRHTGKWYQYDYLEPNIDLQVLVDEVSKDPIGIFWG